MPLLPLFTRGLTTVHSHCSTFVAVLHPKPLSPNLRSLDSLGNSYDLDKQVDLNNLDKIVVFDIEIKAI